MGHGGSLRSDEGETFTRAVLDNLPMGIAVNSVAPSVRFLYMNDSFSAIYHVEREKLTHPDVFWEAVYEDPTFREVMRARVLADCASGDPDRMHWEDVPITRRGEETYFISARNTPIPGQPLVISTVWDVTLRNRAELRARNAEERTRAILNATPEAVFVVSEDGSCLEANPAAVARYGYSREELLRMNVSDLSVPPRRGEVGTRLRDAKAMDTQFEWRHQARDGTEIAVEILTRPITWEDRRCILASVRDVSLRKRAEARITEQLDELRRWHEATLGREERILELKREVNLLLARSGEAPRYPSAGDRAS